MARGVGSSTGSRSQPGANRQPSLDQTRRRSPAKTPSGEQRQKSSHWLGWGVLFTLVTLTSAALGATLALVTPFQATTDGSEPQEISLGELFQRGFQYGISRPVNILVMGIDRVPNTPPDSPEAFNGRSDTMLLVRVDPKAGAVNLLSVPRDTQVEIPPLGLTKINYANVEGGPRLAAQVLSQILNDVPVDRYVRISPDAFRELVDVVGGVEVNVPKRMYYVDQTQKLFIDLQPGLQTLNGTQAEGFARFRHDEYGDIGRTQRQQTLLKALQKKLTNPVMITRLPQVFSVLEKYIDTNLSLGEMLALGQFALRLQPGDFKMVLLPGRFSSPDEFIASYWLMDPEGRNRVMQNYFNISPPTQDGSEGNAALNPQYLKIAIQNASGKANAASQMADYLANQGYGNVYIENDWPETEATTQVIAQRGDLEAAKTLQSVLRTGAVAADSTGSIDSDLTIRVGRDWLQTDPGQ